jgi:hypothetical protein
VLSTSRFLPSCIPQSEMRRGLEATAAPGSGAPLGADLVDDPGLQRGIVEACRLAAIDPESVPEFAGLTRKLGRPVLR